MILRDLRVTPLLELLVICFTNKGYSHEFLLGAAIKDWSFPTFVVDMASKLPSYLYGTYMKSKDDTQYCTSYLVNNARRVGHDISRYIKESGDTSGFPPAADPKGRPFKQALIQIGVSDLLLLANAIAVNWPAIEIEDEFMRSLRQTLRARKVCAAWFADCVNSDVVDSNKRHLFFIHTLESVLELFAPLHSQQRVERSTRQPQPKNLPSPHSHVVQETGQQFADKVADEVRTLDIGTSESTQPPDYARHHPIAEDTSADLVMNTQDNIVLDDSAANTQDWERFFILHSLLVDLHRIRAFIRQSWHRYKLGECDLVTVSVSTNIAIDIAINLEKEAGLSVEDQKPTMCKYNTVIIKFMLNKMRNSAEAPSKYDIGDSDEIDMIPTDVQDLVFLREYAAALGFLRSWLGSTNEVITNTLKKQEAKLARKKGRSGADDADIAPKSSAAAAQIGPHPENLGNRPGAAHWLWENYMEGRIPDAETSGDFVDPELFEYPENWSNQLQAAFHDSLAWQYTRSGTTNANTVIDLVLERMRDMCMNFCPRLSTAFAVGLFLDARESLGEKDMSRPLSDLDAAAIRCRIKAQLQIASLKKAGFDEERRFDTAFVPGLLSSTARLVARISTQIVDDIYDQGEKAWFLTQKNFRNRLSHNPLACGLHQLYIEQLQSATAVTLADRWMVLMPFAHFYNAARVSGKLSLPWPDLEFLIDVHGPEWIFLGGRPNTISGCLAKYYALLAGAGGALGYSRGSASKPQFYYRRQLWPRFCPLSRYLYRRFGFMGKLKEQRVDFDRETFGQILDLEDLQLIVMELNNHGVNHSIELDVNKLVKKDQLRKRVGRSYLSAVDLLSSIDRILTSELKAMRFDHAALERRAQQALERMSIAKQRAGFTRPVELLGCNITLDTWVIMDAMLSYYRLKCTERDLDDRVDLESAKLPWTEDIMSRWDSSVEGLEEWLQDMKKKGVKDLCSDLL